MQTTKEAPFVAATAEDPVERINTALATGDIEEAYTWLQTLIDSDTNSAQACTTAGLVAMQLDRPTEANRYFVQALELAPDDYVTNYNMALSEMRGQRYDRALNRFRHLRRLDPGNVDLLNDLGVVWLQQGNNVRALASFSRAMRLDCDHSTARNNAMELCLENGLTDQADRLLRRQESRQELSLKARAEIHRWRQVLHETDATQEVEAENPVDTGKD